MKTVFFTHSLRSFVKKLFSPPKRKIYIFAPPTVSLRLQTNSAAPPLPLELRRNSRLISEAVPFSYPEPFLLAVNGPRRGALAKTLSNWKLIGYNEDYCFNTGYILLSCFYGIRLWIWPSSSPDPSSGGPHSGPGSGC